MQRDVRNINFGHAHNESLYLDKNDFSFLAALTH